MKRRPDLLLAAVLLVLAMLLVSSTARIVIKARKAQAIDARIEQTLKTINNVVNAFN